MKLEVGKVVCWCVEYCFAGNPTPGQNKNKLWCLYCVILEEYAAQQIIIEILFIITNIRKTYSDCCRKNVMHLCTPRQVIIQLSDCLTFLFYKEIKVYCKYCTTDLKNYYTVCINLLCF